MDISILDLAKSGMKAQQTRVDFVGHNLANQQTPGFRALRPELVDLPANQNVFGVSPGQPMTVADDPTQGVIVAQVFEPNLTGPVLNTGGSLDVALPDGIYLAVTLANGQTAYTRNGQVAVGADGALQAGENRVASSLRIPNGGGSAFVDASGQILIDTPQGQKVLGTLPLVRIPNPEEMTNLGQGLSQPTVDSGAAQPATATDVKGLVPQALEGSNVQMDQELTHLMRAQRAYQANSRMIHTWDELTSGTIQELGHS